MPPPASILVDGAALFWKQSRSYLVLVESQRPDEARLVREMAMAMWAVEQWADFPVDHDPRPLVFTGSIVIPEEGFRTAEAKVAFARGDIEVQGPVLDGVLAILRGVRSSERHSGSILGPLVLTDGKKSERSFSTDRGPRILPAWLFKGRELLGVLWVLDPDVAAKRWTPMEPSEQPAATGGRVHLSIRSRIAPDDHTLHFEFTGGPPEWVDYPSSEVIESDHAVVVIPVGFDLGPPGPRRAVGYRREVVVQLRSRLGNRVLINLDASPIAVLT